MIDNKQCNFLTDEDWEMIISVLMDVRHSVYSDTLKVSSNTQQTMLVHHLKRLDRIVTLVKEIRETFHPDKP